MSRFGISSPSMRVEVSSLGAELISLKDSRGRDLLWHGDTAWWGGRAQILFPIVGRLPDDKIAIDGIVHGMHQHGFARTSEFVCTSSTSSSCRFELASSLQSKAMYPFDFLLSIRYEVVGLSLVVTAEVQNKSKRPMPFSIGFHPAFLWPLPPGNQRSSHVIEFEWPEDAQVLRTRDGLMLAAGETSPVKNGVLTLDDRLFDQGVIIFDKLASRSVSLRAPGSPSVNVSFPSFPHLGIWSKPGAPFICVEPWQGYATPFGYSGELRDKPGIISLAPQATQPFSMQIEVIE